MAKSTINGAMFNSYASFPEGTSDEQSTTLTGSYISLIQVALDEDQTPEESQKTTLNKHQ